jgi:hypothetical protein
VAASVTGAAISTIATVATSAAQESAVTAVTTAVPVNAVATCAADAVAPCATARATATFGVGARFTSIAPVTCDSGIPACVATRATVPAIATITFELAGIAAIAWRSARAAAFKGVRKTISTKDSGIRAFCRAITEKHIDARG